MNVVTAALRAWAAQPDIAAFPYAAVVDAYQQVGKHFAAPELLAALVEARIRLPDAVAGTDADRRRLAAFLDVALDKHDGRYDYRTYLALPLLPLPDLDQAPPAKDALAGRDRLHVQLLADLVHFELAASAGKPGLLPQHRPDDTIVAKRHRLGLRAAVPALQRLHLAAAVHAHEPDLAAARAWAAVDADTQPAERQTLRLTMLPVATVHDEYLFIRVLQAFETTFALLAANVRAAADDLTTGQPTTAAGRLRTATGVLRECAPLWSLMATMRPAAFRAFRRYTEGASAIQSRHYKLLEAVARRPDDSRLHSPAYTCVPEVRSRVLAGQRTIDDAYHAATKAGRLTSQDERLVREAMRAFAAAVENWRRTHHRLAVRMLDGLQPGTGYTAGVPYLERARHHAVFRHVP